MGRAGGAWEPAAEHEKHVLSSLAAALVLMLRETKVNLDCIPIQHMWGPQDQALM